MTEVGHVRVSGAALGYEVSGAGAALLLVRPLGGTMALWGEFRAQLARSYRVISFDLPGTGSSRARAGGRSTRDLARDAVAVLDHLAIERAHVFGISLGSLVATWLAVDAPTRVDRLCLASPCVRGLDVLHRGLGRELSLAACFLHRRAEVEPRIVERVLSARFRREKPHEVARILATVRASPTTRRTLAALAVAAARHDARHALAQIRAPTLVLAGDDDALFGTTPARAVSDAIPGATFALVPSGHDITLEQPVLTALRVESHLG